MIDDRLARRVGTAVILVMLAAVTAVLMLDNLSLRRQIEFEVEFGHVGKLVEGADVMVGGEVIGRVRTIELGKDRVIVRARIERRYQDRVPQNGEFFTNSKGMFGGLYLEIGPPPDDVPIGPPIEEGARVVGKDPPRLEKVVLRSFANAATFRFILQSAAPSARELVAELRVTSGLLSDFEQRSQSLAEVRERLGRTLDEADRLLTTIEQGTSGHDIGELIARAGALGDSIGRQLSTLEPAVATVMAELERIGGRVPAGLGQRVSGAIAAFRRAAAKFEAATVAATALARRVSRGQGTVGALMNDPEFIDDAKKLGKIIKRQPWRVIGVGRPKK